MSTENTDRLDAFDITALTQKNLHNRTPELDTQLARLRMECGEVQRKKAGSPKVSRPASTDVFAGVKGLPEIVASELTPATLAAGILHHGGLLVRGLYRPAHLARLQEVAALQEEANRGDNAPLSCTPYTLFDLVEIYRDCGLLSAVTGYLGGEPLLFAERAKLRHYRVETDAYAGIPWHQDVNFFGPRTYAVNCWAAVTSCGAGNSGLAIIPANIEERIGWKEEDGIAPLDYARAIPKEVFEEIMTEFPAAYPILEPGDALLFDEMTVHRTAGTAWELTEQIVTIGWFFRAAGFPGWGTPLAV